VTSLRARGSTREAGFTLVDMMFVLALIGMLSTLALPALLRAKSAAHSASALGTVRIISGAQLSYALTCGLGFFAPDLPTLGVPPSGFTDTFLPAELTTGAAVLHNGYTISLYATPLAGTPPTCNGLAAGATAPTYVIVADPIDPVANPRFFGLNSDGVVYEDSATFVGTMPETGAPPSGAPLDR
jgi:type II secretory pathway pseudopilin PulG